MAVESAVWGKRFKLSWLPLVWCGTVVMTHSQEQRDGFKPCSFQTLS